ncbi:hypothetical protein N7519_007997 [Penicillium mononematosum]|uniref:uncharacterized protein n=1 Tax=Penicillium mononematosum TaxID=268346 RepID=UPI0025477D93|nr:uncharacterized protein N7519_007997 [Penicillium mononematosum]KAJ6186696.1 hypothetical protein N7519_007997 [Penicillium mononematosum]
MPVAYRRFDLDDKGHVKVEDLTNGTQLATLISRLEPLRDVDWRSTRLKYTRLTSNQQAIAAHVDESQGTEARNPQTQADGGAFTKEIKQFDSNGIPFEYLRAKKRKRTIEYDSTYYQSPLDQSDLKAEGKYSEKRHALESIHTVYDRVVQDIDRLFQTLSQANELESDEDTEGQQEDLVVVEPDMAAEDAQKDPGETPVKEEESEKKDVKIVESAVKKEEEEEEVKPTIPHKPRAARGKGKKVLAIEEK